jgi:type 1 glutamine amidotransferase
MHFISKFSFGLLFLLSVNKLCCQPTKVLHYSETGGFDHQTRLVSYAMFQQMGTENGFGVDHDSIGDSFNSLTNLQQYDVIVFSNTTGNNILNSIQRQNFENYMGSGGGFIGIHSASDTYRHSSSGGNDTGNWDWYAEMLGASVQNNPYHVNGTPVYKIETYTPHLVLNGVPSPWYKAEEYYYWESGYFNLNNVVLQKVEKTIGPNNQINSYDSSRAVTWYKLLPNGGKSFYTALGHAAENYTNDTNFYKLLLNAVVWAGDESVGFPSIKNNEVISVSPIPVFDYIYLKGLPGPGQTSIFDFSGKEILSISTESKEIEIDLSEFPSGMYYLNYQNGRKIVGSKFLIFK